MSGNTVKPWTQIVRVRDDIRTGRLSLQEFAADLFDVVNQTNKRPIYEDPAKFFSLRACPGTTDSVRLVVEPGFSRETANDNVDG